MRHVPGQSTTANWYGRPIGAAKTRVISDGPEVISLTSSGVRAQVRMAAACSAGPRTIGPTDQVASGLFGNVGLQPSNGAYELDTRLEELAIRERVLTEGAADQ